MLLGFPRAPAVASIRVFGEGAGRELSARHADFSLPTGVMPTRGGSVPFVNDGVKLLAAKFVSVLLCFVEYPFLFVHWKDACLYSVRIDMKAS